MNRLSRADPSSSRWTGGGTPQWRFGAPRFSLEPMLSIFVVNLGQDVRLEIRIKKKRQKRRGKVSPFRSAGDGEGGNEDYGQSQP